MHAKPRLTYCRQSDGRLITTIRELPDFVVVLDSHGEPSLLSKATLAAQYCEVA